MRKIHYGYIVVFCLFFVMFLIVGLVMSCAGIFYKPVSEDLGFDVGKFGVYMSLNFLFFTLTLSFAGKWIEKYSARIILSLSAAVAGLTFVAMSQFHALWQFYMAGILFGISLAFLLYLGLPTLLNRWFKTRLGICIGICSAGSGIGGVLFNLLGGYLITEYGWRTAYMVFGCLILVAATPVLALLLRDYPSDKGILPYGSSETRAVSGENMERGMEYARAVRTPVFYGLVLFAFLMNAAATLNVFVPAYSQEIRFSIEEASFVASAVMTGVTVGKIGLGGINDRNTLAGVLVTTGFGIAGISLLLLGHIHLLVSIAGGFLFGWAYAGVSVQTPLLVRSVFGNRSYARIYSNVSMAIAVGGAVAAGGWGILADAISFRFILWSGMAFLLVSGIIGLWALRYNKQSEI
ncbi:MFS transporter [Bacteroides thetaiotaomicron]|uniref:MFS transporter n=3 Tax=Bacteroides thetaiotaomicron TaxID=818 RepID=UPI00326178FC